MSETPSRARTHAGTHARAHTGTATIGVLYPGFGAEDDYPALEARLGGRVRLPLVHTSVGEDAHRVDALLDLGGTERLAEGTRALLELRPDAVMWACTSGSFVFGWDGARRQAEQVAEVAGCPASSTSIGFVNAARALGVTSVAVAASYPEDVAVRFTDFLGRAGIAVGGIRSHAIMTATEVGQLGRDEVLALASSVDTAGAHALLIPDTAMHTLEWVDAMEGAAGVPLLTANQVTVWEGLRLLGPVPRLDGLGRLFR